MHSVLIARWLPLMMLPALTGCVITGPMWEAANNRSAGDPALIGVIEPPERDAGADGGQRLLVIRYGLNFDDDFYATIPLTPQGCPIAPYDYEGDERRPDAIVSALPEARRQQLREMRLVLHDEKWAKRLKANPNFRRVEWTTDGSNQRDVAFERGSGKGCYCCRRRDIRVRAFRLGRPWTESENAAMRLEDRDARTFPTDACILVLPYAQPRPEAHYRKAQWRAALWTPVALVGDAAVIASIPVFVVLCYGFGQCV